MTDIQNQESNDQPKVKNNILMDTVSLQSLGIYMLFKPIDDVISENFCEFIIKANSVFSDDQPLTIMINSPGGEVYSGFGMIDLMETSRLQIQTVGVGCVASMASFILSAGTKGMRIMSKNSFLMSHCFSSGSEGKYHEFVAARSHEDTLHTRGVEHYLKYSNLSEAKIKDILLGNTDRWLTPKEALKYGLCDKISNPWS